MSGVADQAGFCKRCGYDLRAAENRCSECGREFSWQNARTFRKRPLSRSPWKRLIQAVGAAAALLILGLAIVVGPDYWQWRRNRKAIEVARNVGGSAALGQRVPLWWTRYLGHRWDFLGDRVATIGAHPESPPWSRPFKFSDSDLYHLRGLKELQYLNLNAAPGVTDVGLQYISEIPNLEQLHLEDAQITDAGLQHLANLKRLNRLDLGPHNTDAESRITDVGFKAIEKMPSLSYLVIEQISITPARLRILTNMRNLETVWLIRTDITDATLEEFQHFKSLKQLLLNHNDNLTSEGVNRLKIAFPGLQVNYAPSRRRVPAAQSQRP